MHEKEPLLVPNGDVIGRRVDFTDGLPLAWGIEIELPFDSREKERLDHKYGIKIPDRINRFNFLDLNPQESMPGELRNLARNDEWLETYLYDLVSSGHISQRSDLIRRRRVEDMFFSIFGWNLDKIEKFNYLIEENKGDTLIFVSGHSGRSPWKLGEHSLGEPRDRNERKYQKLDNDVSIRQILKKYNDPEKYSAILVIACYNGEKRVRTLDVPLIYATGNVGGEWGLSAIGQNPTIIVHARNKLRNT